MSTIAKKWSRGLLAVVGSAFCLVAVALGVGNVVLASSETSAEQDLVKAVAMYLYDHQDSEVARLAARYLVQANGQKGDGSEVLGILLETKESPIERVCFKDSDGLVCRAVFWEEMDLPASSANTTTVSEPTRLSKPYWLDYAMLEMEGTVSGSNQGLLVSVGTTTNGHGPIFNASTSFPQFPRGIIMTSHFPTSSQNVQFARGYNYRNYYVATSSYAVAFSDFNPAWRIATTSYITAFVQTGGNTSTAGMCDPDTVGVSCEQPTSSNRGWTGRVIWRGHYRVSL